VWTRATRPRAFRSAGNNAGAASYWVNSKGEDKLQFEVNGAEYFLNFVEDERRWFVFAPSPTGLQRLPVYIDGSNYERIAMLDKDRQHRPN
jgi:hypothetical protein